MGVYFSRGRETSYTYAYADVLTSTRPTNQPTNRIGTGTKYSCTFSGVNVRHAELLRCVFNKSFACGRWIAALIDAKNDCRIEEAIQAPIHPDHDEHHSPPPASALLRSYWRCAPHDNAGSRRVIRSFWGGSGSIPCCCFPSVRSLSRDQHSGGERRVWRRPERRDPRPRHERPPRPRRTTLPAAVWEQPFQRRGGGEGRRRNPPPEAPEAPISGEGGPSPAGSSGSHFR